jgi:hypothetical protein
MSDPEPPAWLDPAPAAVPPPEPVPVVPLEPRSSEPRKETRDARVESATRPLDAEEIALAGMPVPDDDVPLAIDRTKNGAG